MSEKGAACRDPSPDLAETKNEAENSKAVSKQTFRKKIWEYLEKNRLVNFPRPVHGRIPNFKGSELAARQLLELDQFKSAKSIEVNPDKPLEFSRAIVLEEDKILYVPVPRLQNGLLKKLSFCEEDKPINIKQCVTRWGIDTLGKSVDLENHPKIDLLVMGSVAVTKTGRRIGKGKGFADLEFAILKEIKAVDDETVIVTTVHDSQILDHIPDEIFENFDVPVDIILTPTQIIKVEKKLPRPEGIYWNLISQRKLTSMPILQKLKEMQLQLGKEVILKDADTDIESDEKPVASGEKSKRDSKKRSNKQENAENEKPRRGRYFRRTRVLKDKNTNVESETTNDSSTEPGAIKKRFSKVPRKSSKRLQVDFSLMVSNIDKTIRVRTLKLALIDHRIKPSNITWRGYKGFCYLHYAKPSKKENSGDDVSSNNLSVDNVVEILQSLKLNSESQSELSVKVLEPTRIETTDVTAV